MRFVLILLILIFQFPNKVEAQTSEEIQFHLSQYFESITNKDYDTLYSILSPNYQKHLPKDYMLKLFSDVEDNDKFVNQMVDFDLDDTSDLEPVIYDDIAYIKIDCESERNLIYNATTSNDYIEKANSVFRKADPNSFEYHPTERKVVTKKLGSVILCIDLKEDEPKFYFIPYLPKLKPYMHLLIPEGAVNQLLN